MITNSSSIITDGLILNIDASNLKSYKGPAIQNVLTTITPRGIGDNGSTYRAFSGTENVYIPSYGYVKDCAYVDWYNDYNGGSGNCCPSLFGYGDGLTVSGNTVYTYAILYRSVNRYTNGNLMYHYEFGPSGYITEFGVHNAGYPWQETHLGNGWYWSRAKFTTNANTTSVSTGTWMYQYATWNRLYVAAVALMPGDYTNLHPKYWPTVGTTRSNTSNLVDLTGNKTITANSLTYANDGTFSFGGSDYLTMTNTTLGNGDTQWTCSAWVKTTTTVNSVGGGSVISNSSGGPVYSMMGVNNGKIVYWTYQNNAWTQKLGVGKTVNDNVWHMLTWVNYGNYTMDMYVDGVLDSNVANSTSGNNNPVDRIGGSWSSQFVGSISNLSIYNRSLNAREVKQNFNALSGKYGV